MIVGTAGHIDHGKTTLVRALTGVDTDRLPEEKKRGISIELGYAFLPVPGLEEPVGFIDVPGHERLVHTMLAGASGIDLALLLVAADDGPMPQTREHLAVLSLLGLARGAVVVTKADRVDAARLAAVQAEAAALVAGTPLAGSPVFTVSAATGDGVPALRDWLFAQAWADAARSQRAADDAAFRLAIDRAFTLDGVGTVVTGTVHAGEVRVGDELRLAPCGFDPRVRVRSLRAQNREVAVARAGQRCAVGLVGVNRHDIQRGQWLVGGGAVSVGDRLDVQLTVWPGEAKALRSGTPVQVHLGAASGLASVAVLATGDSDSRRRVGDDTPAAATASAAAGERIPAGNASADSIAPGASARVQLVLRAPLGAWRGDRVVLRDASATRTIAGGVVLDPQAPARYRRTPERLAELAAWAAATAAERLQGLLAAGAHGVDLARWARAEGRTTGRPPALPPGALVSDDHAWALDATHAEALQARVLQALADFHQKAPEELGPDAARLRRLAAPRLPEPLWRALLARLLAGGQVQQRGAFVHLAAHGVSLSATELRLLQKVTAALGAAGFEGAWVRDLARDSGESEPLMRTALARVAQRGELHQVVKDLYYPLATMATLARLAREVGTRDGEVKAATFRDATGLGRKRAIQILEYFDRVGLLRRVGDTHRLRGDTALFSAEAP